MPAYKNQFGRPKYYDHEILNEKGNKIGTLRVKPTGVLWKPRSQQKFYGVPLDKFKGWITDSATEASRTKS